MESYSDRQKARLEAKQAAREQKKLEKEASREQKKNEKEAAREQRQINRVQKIKDRHLAAEERRQMRKLYNQWAVETAKLIKKGASDKDISFFLQNCDLDKNTVVSMAHTKLFKESLIEQAVPMMLKGSSELEINEFIVKQVKDAEDRIDDEEINIDSIIENIKFKYNSKHDELMGELSKSLRQYLKNGKHFNEVDIQPLLEEYFVDKAIVERRYMQVAKDMYHEAIRQSKNSSEDQITPLLFLADILGKNESDVKTDIENSLKAHADKKAKEKKKKRLGLAIKIITGVLIVLQIYFLHWWAILTGPITLLICKKLLPKH